MSVFSELVAPGMSASVPGPLDNFWYGPAPSKSGITINTLTAMQIATVTACVRVLAETVASLPLIIYKRQADGGKKRATDHPLYKILHSTPSEKQTSFELREQMMMHLGFRGNAIVEIVKGGFGKWVGELKCHCPDNIRVEKLVNGDLKYIVREKSGSERVLFADDVWRVSNLSWDGKTGLSPIALHSNSMGLSIAAESFGSNFFKNGAKATGVLKHPKTLSEDAQKRLKIQVMEKLSGDNQLSPLVLEEDMDWSQLTIAPEEAQFLETRKYQDIDICKIYRMPPHMIGILDRSTFNNIEHQSIGFVVHTIMPWLKRFEQSITRDLMGGDEEYFAEFLVDGLLRGDTKTRYMAYGKAITDGWMKPNEARIRENMNPEEALDNFRVPLNMRIIGESENKAGKVVSGGIKKDSKPEPDKPTPAPAADKKAPSEPDDTPKADDKNAAAFFALAHDAAERIHNAEIRGLEKRMQHAATDRGRFNKWVNEFYQKHCVYFTKVIEPVVTGWGDNARSAEDFAKAITDSRCKTMTGAEEPAGLFNNWVKKGSEIMRLCIVAEYRKDL